MSEHGNRFSLLGPQLLGLSAGLLGQGFTELPQTPFQGLGRGFELAQKFSNQAVQQRLSQQTLQNQIGQQDITNDFAKQRLGLAKERVSIARAGVGQTSLLKNLAAADAADAAGNPELANNIRSAMSTPQTQVNITNEGDRANSKEMGRVTVAAFAKAQDAAGGAFGRKRNAAIVRRMMKDPNLYTGTGGELALRMKKLGLLLGLNVEGVAPAAIMNILGTKAALQSQKEMPVGKLTDKDAAMLISMTTGLSKTPETNRRLLLIAGISDDLLIAKAQVWRDARDPQTNVISPSGFEAIARLEAQAISKISAHLRTMTDPAKQLKSKAFTTGMNIDQMSVKQIGQIDKTSPSVTLNQLIQMRKRLKQLKGAPDA